MGFVFDKDEIRKQCDDFFSMYNVTKVETREMCVRKRVHTHAVAENSRQIAGALGLNKYDRDMAWVIGELHDFARFGQAVVTGTFRDSNQYDHAAMAVRLLFKHGMIEDIIPGYHDISEEEIHEIFKEDGRREGREEERKNTEAERRRADAAEAEIRQLKEKLARFKAGSFSNCQKQHKRLLLPYRTQLG